MSVSISDLSIENIYWIYWLATLEVPCGLIHNETDKVIWTNNCSVLKPGAITTNTHVDKDKLVSLKQLINDLPLVEFKDKHEAYINYRYKLISSGIIIEVLDKFYKVKIGGEIFRVFEQIDERIV